MKKAFAALLASFIFVFAFAGTALAAEGPTVTVPDASATAGEQVTLEVSIADNPGITNTDITVNYEAEAMELTGITAGEVLSSGMFDGNIETGIVSWATSGDAVATDGVLCTYTFSVLDTAVNGNHTVSVDCTYGTEDVDEATAESKSGTVTVTGGVDPAPELTPFKVYTQEGADGEKVLAKEFTGDELAALANDSQMAHQWAKGVAVTDYWVSLDELLEAAGADDKWAAGSALDYEHRGDPDMSYEAVTAAATLYSDAEDGSAGGSGDVVSQVVPALALNYYKAGTWADGAATVAEAIAASLAGDDSGYTMFWGSSPDMGGNVHFNGIDEITVVYPKVNSLELELDVTEATETYGYDSGAVTLGVTADASDDVAANPITYQWYSNTSASSEGGTAVSGATSASYAADELDAGTYYYYCVASGTGESGAISATSDVATVTIAKAASSITWNDGITETTSSNSIALSGDSLTTVTGSDAGVKYAITTGEAPAADSDAWQDSASFTGLSADTAYSVFAMVPANSNYESAVSGAKTVSTMAAGAVENPTPDAVTYSPSQTLADVALPEGWAWSDSSVVPDVKTGTYTAVFTPTDTDTVDYADVEGWDAESQTVTRDVALTVNKATPVISTPPTASDITYGQTLADSTLSDGAADVPGTFAWTTTSKAPSVADSGTAYAVTFTPDDTDNYNTASTETAVTVNPADASEATVSGIEKAYDYTGSAVTPSPTVKLGDTILVEGTDYTVKYDNNQSGGSEASYTIDFMGNYVGESITGTFVIKPVVDGEVVIDPSLKGEASADEAQLDAVINEAIEYYKLDKDLGIIVRLEVDPADMTDEQTKADVAMIEDALAELGTDYQIGEVYEVTLTAYHGAETTDIGDTNTSIVSVVYTFDFTGKKNVVVFRVHDGVVDQLTETPNADGEYIVIDKANGTITVAASKYSSYSIGYEPADEPVDNPDSGSADNASGSSSSDTSKSATAKTGDTIPPLVPMTLSLIAICAFAVLVLAWRIRRREMR